MSAAIQTNEKKPLLESFATLFYVCKILGLNSQDWKEFRRHKHLKKSSTGNVLVVIGAVILFTNFNLMILKYQSTSYLEENNPLVVAVAVILTYFSLALVLCDRVNAFRKQQSFSNIFVELEEIDQDLSKLNIFLHNNYVKHRLVLGILLSLIVEVLIFTLTLLYFLDQFNWTSWLWIYAHVPIYFNTIDKLWYVGVVIAIRKRFEAINKALDVEALKIASEKLKQSVTNNAKGIGKDTNTSRCTSINKTQPSAYEKPAVSQDVLQNASHITMTLPGSVLAFPRTLYNSSKSATPLPLAYETLEHKFNKLCQLHNSLCNVTGNLNDVYSLPNLMLMGYGFCMVVGQLYFFYSSNFDQEIPSLFRPVQIWSLSSIYILYIFSKCVIILYASWQTSLESKRTGICIHRCGMAANDNLMYELINHLSLKLLNHSVVFNACGFFPLNMTTLFGFCGGIATYLIIFIQFNLEEQQAKFNSKNVGGSIALIPNEMRNNNSGHVVRASRSDHQISLLSMFYQLWHNYIANA